VAATLRALPVNAFFTVVLQLARPGFLTICILTFAHMAGEFDVALMIGGNLSVVSHVASLRIYDYVQAFIFEHHRIAAVTQ
jgi:molybdate transport system permease protein